MPTLTWLTREIDLKLSQNAPYRLLEAVPELSYGDATAENMLIQGDNLDALKALLPYYAGRVKCIYIDLDFIKVHDLIKLECLCFSHGKDQCPQPCPCPRKSCWS